MDMWWMPVLQRGTIKEDRLLQLHERVLVNLESWGLAENAQFWHDELWL